MMIPRSGAGGRNVNPGWADEVFAEHEGPTPALTQARLLGLKLIGEHSDRYGSPLS